MKTNFIRRMATAICLLSCICIYSCKKDESASQDTTAASLGTAGDDQQQVSNESDMIINDANNALNGDASYSGANDASMAVSSGVNSLNEHANGSGEAFINAHQYICDAIISYDTANNLRVITIKYDGTNCWGNRTRNGTVIVTMPVGQRWKDAGATATITVDTLTITRLRDNKSIVLNGTKTLTNTSGGLLKDLSTLQTITHNIHGSLVVGFGNGTSRTWNVSKQRVFTYDDGIVITTTGTYSDGTDNNIAEWGTNRFNESFKSLISAPKVIRQDCDFRLVSGQNTVIIGKGVSVITYGLDANGDPTGCPGTGTYYLKLVWTGANGKTYTIILPY
jgi:hypothetical protein